MHGLLLLLIILTIKRRVSGIVKRRIATLKMSTTLIWIRIQPNFCYVVLIGWVEAERSSHILIVLPSGIVVYDYALALGLIQMTLIPI